MRKPLGFTSYFKLTKYVANMVTFNDFLYREKNFLFVIDISSQNQPWEKYGKIF